jgi:hypothetical protein
LLLCAALGLAGCRSTKPDMASVGIAFKSTGPKSKYASTRNHCYAELAHEVLRRVGELRTRFPQFARMDPEDLRWQEPVVTNDKLWIAFRYESAVEWGPPEKEGKTLHPVPKAYLSPEGISLRIYFLTGPWTGDADLTPKAIGKMKVAAFVEVPDAAADKKLGEEIGRIIDDEASRYDNECDEVKHPK